MRRVSTSTTSDEASLKPHRVSVLLNASSGTIDAADRDQLRDALQSAFEKHGMSASLQFLSGAELRPGAERALEKATRGDLDAIVVGGGDGSIRTVASVMAGSSVPLGIIPLGTLNHFAKDLKIPLTVEDAVAIIAGGEARPVDAGEVNGRIFINNSSIGIYPYLVIDRERRMRRAGLPKWPAMILAGFTAIRNFPLRRLSICGEGWTEPCRSPCVFVGNNTYQLSGPSLGSRARLDEGRLCLYVAKQQSLGGLLWLAVRCIFGLLDQPRDLRTLVLPAVEISSRERRLLVAFDGEIEVLRSPLHYRSRPGALRVFAPAAAAKA
jgi:diacylglycerol kinase family enzyme